MTDSKPKRTAGPLSYLVTARELFSRGFGLQPLDEVLIGLTKLFLSSYGHSQEKVVGELKRKIRDKGLWAFTNVYWRDDCFYVKNDTLGIGHELLTENELKSREPYKPQRAVDISSSTFGRFSPAQFLEADASLFLGAKFSKQLERLASQDGLDIRLSGLQVGREDFVKTVCSISFHDGYLHIDLADNGRGRHYAIGKAPPKGYNKSRFGSSL